MKLVGPFTELLPLDNLPDKGAIDNHQMEVIKQGGVLIEEGKVVETGVF